MTNQQPMMMNTQAAPQLPPPLAAPADVTMLARRAKMAVLRTLEGRGLQTPDQPSLVARFFLAIAPNGSEAWLIAFLDRTRIQRIEQFVTSHVTHQMSTLAGGLPVVISNSTGLRYCVRLKGQKALLPTSVSFPGWKKGILQFGMGRRGPVEMAWDKMNAHMLVAGMTRFGKSNFLRLMLDQAIQEGCKFFLIDPKAQFNSLRHHPSRLFPAPSAGFDTPETAMDTLRAAHALMQERIALFGQGTVDDMNLARYNELHPRSQLARIIILIDEFSGLAQATGGGGGEVAALVAQLAWHGAGLGIHLIVAGQTFEKELVGRMRDQFAIRLCLPVDRASVSKVVLGEHGAETLAQPGRALGILLDGKGALEFQTYRIDAFTHAAGQTTPLGLTPQEEDYARKLAQAGGRMSREAIMAVLGVSEREARRISAEWRTRGLAVQDRLNDNAVCLAPDLMTALAAGAPCQPKPEAAPREYAFAAAAGD